MIDNKLRITAGNTFATAHTITAQDVQGQPIPDFDLQQCTDIQVFARNGGSYKPVTSWQTDDQSVVVFWYGKQMKLGGYDFYIAGKFNGADWRTSEATIFEIVQYNEEANIPADTIVVDSTYFLDASFSLITEIHGGGGGATPSDDLPLMDGTADAGTSNKYSRGDHVHPSDTSKQDVIADLATIRSGAAAGATAYQKPQNGIPKSDLASGVQNSLGKADTAVQPAAIADMATETYVGTAVGTEETRAKGVESGLQDAIDLINAKIPSAASAQNQLADKNWVNSSISTNTATFKGTYNSLADLQQVTATNNDYAFVIETDSVGNEYYDRYKYVTGTGWEYEYKVESTPFTSDQWAAIQSGITSALVTKLSALPTNSELTTALGGKQATIDSTHKLSADLVDDASTTNKFVTAAEKTTWNNKSDFSGSYNDLTNKPTIPAAQVNSDWDASSGVAQILNKPTIPTALSQLTEDTTHRVVTDTEKAAWNGKANKVLVNNHGTDDTTYSVTPNTLHIWGEVASLTLTLATPTDNTIKNEYMIQFTSGATATQFSLPQGVEWGTQDPEQPNPLVVKANAIYQISIENNIGLWTAIANS